MTQLCWFEKHLPEQEKCFFPTTSFIQLALQRLLNYPVLFDRSLLAAQTGAGQFSTVVNKISECTYRALTDVGFPTSSTVGFLEEEEQGHHLTPLSPALPSLQQVCPPAPSGPFILIIKPANYKHSLVLATTSP